MLRAMHFPFSRDSTLNQAESNSFFRCCFIQHSIKLKMLTLIVHRARLIAIKWRQCVGSVAPAFATRRQSQLFVIYSCIKSIKLCLSRTNPINLNERKSKVMLCMAESRISPHFRSWNWFHLILKIFPSNLPNFNRNKWMRTKWKIRKSQNGPTSSFCISSIFRFRFSSTCCASVFTSHMRTIFRLSFSPSVCLPVFGHFGLSNITSPPIDFCSRLECILGTCHFIVRWQAILHIFALLFFGAEKHRTEIFTASACTT